MKGAVVFGALFLLSMLGFYACMAFVALEINPTKWPKDMRIGYIFAIPMSVFLACVLPVFKM